MKSYPILLFFILILFGFMMPSTAATDTLMKPQFDRTSRALTIVVIVHENYDQVTQAKKLKYAQDSAAGRLYGWTSWGATPEGTCEINVSKAEQYMDKEFTVWGHELAHCLYGNYHPNIE